MKYKKHILFILYTSIVLLTGYFGWPVQMVCVSFASFLVFYLIRNESIKIRLLFLTPSMVYASAGFFINLHTLPITVTPFLFFGFFLFYKKEISTKWLFAICLLLGPSSFVGMHKFLDWYRNQPYKQLTYKKFNYELLNKDSLDVSSKVLNSDSLIVFDCWTISCGICFKKMPDFLALKEKMKNRKVTFYTLNLPFKNSSITQCNERIRRFNPLENNLYSRNEKIWDELNIYGVPAYILLKNKEILFIGHGEVFSSMLHANLENEILTQLETIE